MSKILLVSALKQEAEAFYKNLESPRLIQSAPYKLYEGEINSRKILLTYSGMGGERAVNAVNTAASLSNISGIISFGYAGAVKGGAKAGDTFICKNIYRFEAEELVKTSENSTSDYPDIPAAALITVKRPLPKERLRKVSDKIDEITLTDMETSDIAQIAKDFSIPFISLRSVTDTDNEDIPFNLDELCDRDGMPDKGKIFSYCMKNPAIMPQLAAMSKKSAIASENLAKALLQIIR